MGRQSLSVAALPDDWFVGQRQRPKETTWSSYNVATTRIKGGLGANKLKALTPSKSSSFTGVLLSTVAVSAAAC